MAQFKALYGRHCHTLIGQFVSTKPKLYDTYLLQEALPLVRVAQERLRTTNKQHQSYVNPRCRPYILMLRDRMFLQVLPLKRLMRFGKQGKLSPQYIGSFEIQRSVGVVSYELALPPAYSVIDSISMFQYYASMCQINHMCYSMIQFNQMVFWSLLRNWQPYQLEMSGSFSPELYPWLRSSRSIIQVRRPPRRLTETCRCSTPAYLNFQLCLILIFADESFCSSGCYNDPLGYFYVFMYFFAD